MIWNLVKGLGVLAAGAVFVVLLVVAVKQEIEFRRTHRCVEWADQLHFSSVSDGRGGSSLTSYTSHDCSRWVELDQ